MQVAQQQDWVQVIAQILYYLFNPFRFIEAALNEAKSKIEKMKDTPQILESLNDDEK